MKPKSDNKDFKKKHMELKEEFVNSLPNKTNRKKVY